MNRFVFLVPAFNASKTVKQMLASVFYQTHSNWRIFIRDDLSTDNTVDEILNFCNKNNVSCRVEEYHEDGRPALLLGENFDYNGKVCVVKNKTKLWETANVLEMLKHPDIKDDDIIVRLDADDFITDLCALQDMNFVYEKTGCDCLWGLNRWEDQFWKNNSGPMPGCYILDYSMNMVDLPRTLKMEGEKNVYAWSKDNWSTSHPKTFRKHLINDVNDENFRGEDGEYIKRCGDRAIYYPVLHKAKAPLFFPKQMYFYHIDDKPETYQTDDAKFQRAESDFLSARGFVK